MLGIYQEIALHIKTEDLRNSYMREIMLTTRVLTRMIGVCSMRSIAHWVFVCFWRPVLLNLTLLEIGGR